MEATVSFADNILKQFADLPDSAVVPTAVAAKHDHISERTVRRTYPLIKLSERRYGVSVGYPADGCFAGQPSPLIRFCARRPDG
jgi:hypothetical protein